MGRVYALPALICCFFAAVSSCVLSVSAATAADEEACLKTTGAREMLPGDEEGSDESSKLAYKDMPPLGPVCCEDIFEGVGS